MASKDSKEKSLLEVAIELLEMKRKPQKIMNILKEVMEIKGVKASLAKELAPQFLLDFMQSGYFVYCGDDCWDLKDRQPTSVLDKEGGDFTDIYEDDEDVKKNELNDELYEDENTKNANEDDEDENEEEDEEEDDLAREFENFDEELSNMGFHETSEEDEMEEEEE